MIACTVVMVLGTTVGGFQSLLTIHFSLTGNLVLSLGWTLYTGEGAGYVRGVVGGAGAGVGEGTAGAGGPAGPSWCGGSTGSDCWAKGTAWV